MVKDDDADVADQEREPFSTNDVADEHLEGEGKCSTSRINDNVEPSRINDNVEPSRINDNVEPSRINDNVEPSRINDNVEPSRINDSVEPSRINDGVDVEQTDYENGTRVERKEVDCC